MKVLTKITAIFDRIIGLSALFSAILILLIMLAINTQVILRFFAGREIRGMLEAATYSLLYIAFLGSAWLLKGEGHVKMDIVLTRLKPGTQAILNIITSIFGIIISLVLIWWGSMVTLEHFQDGYYIKSVLHPLTWPLLVVIPVGSFLLLIQFSRRTYWYVREWRATLSKDRGHK